MLILGTIGRQFYGQWISCTIDYEMDQSLWQTIVSFDLLHSLHDVNTNSIVMWETLSKQCRLGLFQYSEFAGNLEDSWSTSGGTLCIFGSLTFVPISWMCKKQTSVSHGSSESEIIPLDAGLRMDGIPALDVWDLIVTVLQGNTNRNRAE